MCDHCPEIEIFSTEDASLLHYLYYNYLPLSCQQFKELNAFLIKEAEAFSEAGKFLDECWGQVKSNLDNFSGQRQPF